MRTTFYTVLLSILAVSCAGVKVQQHNLPCHTRNRAQALQTATSLLVQHGLKITVADTLIGLVEAESEDTRDIWTGVMVRRVWQINIRPDVGPLETAKPDDQETLAKPKNGRSMFIIATAKTITRTTNAFGATLATAEHYYDDKAHQDWEWYWGVRQGLESLCDARVVITTKSVN